jgi:hypothetical protein
MNRKKGEAKLEAFVRWFLKGGDQEVEDLLRANRIIEKRHTFKKDNTFKK